MDCVLRYLLKAFSPTRERGAAPAPAKAVESRAVDAAAIYQLTPANVMDGVSRVDPGIATFNGRPVPAYPDKGLAAAAAPPDMLMENQRQTINRLHQLSSFSREEFDAYILPAIRRYAEYVHLLPASESQHHCGLGGLFRHGLEVACNAALACEGRVFAFDRWASERDKLVPRWRMCAILGGMIHDMGKPIIDVGAVDVSGKLEWNPHAGSLYQWLTENGLTEYYIRWRPGARHKRHEAFNALTLHRIVPDETLRWISTHGGQEPLDALIMALSGASDPNNPLSAIIKQSDSKSVAKDIQDSRTRLAASGQGGVRSLAIRLARAMHDLIQDGVWQINKVGSPIWVTSEGVFGLHSAAVRGAVEVLREQGDMSLPHDYSAALEVLADWGFIHPNVLPNGQQFNTWLVKFHATDRGKPVTFDSHAVRFARDEILPRAMIPAEPVPAQILAPDGSPISAGGIISAPAPSVSKLSTSAATQDGAKNASPAGSAVDDGDGGPLIDDLPQVPLAEVEDVVESPAFLLGGDPADGLLLSSGDPAATSTTASGEASTLVRDRANELDPRDEAMLDARQQMSKKWPPESPAAAAAFFEGHGNEGQVILTVTKRLRAGELVEKDVVVELQDKLHFRYPDAFAGLGMEEEDVRSMLEAKGWTERDSASLNRSTVTVNLGGAKRFSALRFNENISQGISLLMPARSGSAVVGHASRRHLPLGPFVDADTASRISDFQLVKSEDHALIRPCWHQFVIAAIAESSQSLEELAPPDIERLLEEFEKQHRLVTARWLRGHIRTRSANSWARVDGHKQGVRLIYNPGYRLDLDVAESSARSSA